MPTGIYKHSPRSEETKRKISQSEKGKIIPKEAREKMSLSHKRLGTKPPSRRGILSSPEHRQKISDANSGEKSHFWRGGITPINTIIRSSLEYRLWREAVFKRDNYTCIWCSARGRIGYVVVLNADHIKPFAYSPELRFAIDNGRTLCAPCHKKTDTFGVRARFNRKS